MEKKVASRTTVFSLFPVTCLSPRPLQRTEVPSIENKTMLCCFSINEAWTKVQPIKTYGLMRAGVFQQLAHLYVLSLGSSCDSLITFSAFVVI